MLNKSGTKWGSSFFLLIVLILNCSDWEYHVDGVTNNISCQRATEHDEYFWVCKSVPENLTAAILLTHSFYYPDELQISDENVSNIESYSFHNNLDIHTLILNLANRPLNFVPESFKGLTTLRTLKINRGTVVIVSSIFKELMFLHTLRLAANESVEPLNEALKDLTRLRSLEILDSYEVNLCPEQHTAINDFKSIYRLQYTGGEIKKLKANSFQCLRNLVILTITRTNLTLIEPGAFDGLDKLEKLTITGNPQLIRIPANVFDSFKSLYQLNLSDNSINHIDEGAFNLRYHNLSLLNVSCNRIDHVETGYFIGLPCQKLDLSRNLLGNIPKDSFNNSIIGELFIENNPWIYPHYKYWGINKHQTIVHHELQSLDFSETLGMQSPQHVVWYACGVDKSFKCCKKFNTSLVFVGQSSHEKSRQFSSQLRLFLGDLTVIEKNAFNDSILNSLIIESSGPELDIQPDALNLPKLKTLEIYTGPVHIRRNIFKQLQSLKLLTIQVKETKVLLCEILPDVPNLISLQILNHYTVNICHEMCYYNTLSLTTLVYNGGYIEVLSTGAFNCLKKLESLRILRTGLTTIEPGAFDGLNSLKRLAFSYNHYLTTISADVFMNLIQINAIEINGFIIDRIDRKDFLRYQNDRKHFYSDTLFLASNTKRLIKIAYGDIYYSLWRQINITENGILFISHDNRNKLELTNHMLVPVQFVYIVTNIVGILAEEDKKSVTKTLSKYPSGPSKPCYLTQTLASFKICIGLNKTLILVTHYGYEKNLSMVVDIRDYGISAIEENAFINLTIDKLIIKSSAEELRAGRKSFEGLSELQTLILLTGPLQLEPHIFKELRSLKNLSLSYNDSSVAFCKLLPDIPELRTLVIYNHHKVDICQTICSHEPSRIKRLQYIGGYFTKLYRGAFSCLKALAHITITETQLTYLEPGTFDGLENMKTLSLTRNYYLQHIPANVFINLKQLIRLELHMNRILAIDRRAFFDFSANANLLILDLSFNRLTAIHSDTFANVHCKVLNISYNEINNIESDSFYDSVINKLYLQGNQDIDRNNSLTWGLNDCTTIYLSEVSYYNNYYNIWSADAKFGIIAPYRTNLYIDL